MRLIRCESGLGLSIWAMLFAVGCTELKPEGFEELPANTDTIDSDSEILPVLSVHLVGDATMASTSPENQSQAGWGDHLANFLDSSVSVKNWAQGGSSTRSFYLDSARRSEVMTSVAEGDYVLLQFGHDDQRGGNDYEQYATFAYCSDGSTNAEACSDADRSYYLLLKRLVEQVQQKGAIPVLVTPVVRGLFERNSYQLSAEASHSFQRIQRGEVTPRGNYPEAMRRLAGQYDVPLIDMTERSTKIVEVAGSLADKELYASADHGLLTVPMAEVLAKMVSQSIAISGDPRLNTVSRLIERTPLFTVVPKTLRLDEHAFGENVVGKLCVLALDMDTSDGRITVEAPAPLRLSDDERAGPGSPTVELAYRGTELITSLFAQFTPSSFGTYNGSLRFSMGSTDYPSLDVLAQTIPPALAAPFSVRWLATDGDTTPTVSGPMGAETVVLNGLDFGNSRILLVEDEREENVARIVVENRTLADNQYAEFVVTTEGESWIRSLSLWLGSSGGSTVEAKIQYADNEAFLNPVDLMEELPGKAKDTMVFLDFPINRVISAQEKLCIRVLPYNPPGGTGKYLAIYNATLEGNQL